MILIEAALILFVGWVALLFAQNFSQLLPFGFKVDDWTTLQTEADALAAPLAPCEGEELRLLATSIQMKSTTQGLFHTNKGTFSTIYNEPMLAFVERRTSFSNPMQRAMLVKTAKDTIKYKQIGEETTVLVNDVLFATILHGVLFLPDNQRFAAIVPHTDTTFSIEVEKKDTATITLKKNTGKHLTRAFDIFQSLTGNEEQARLVLLIREMIERQKI
jgi:hypothetical protein